VSRVASARVAPALVIAVAAALAGCAALPIAPAAPRMPRSCEAVYSVDRCDAMLTAAAESLGVPDDAVTAIEIAPEPTPRSDGILETLGGARPIVVMAHVDGRVEEVLMCGGAPSGPACRDVPALGIGSPIGAGYSDVPCAGEGPEACATPLPSQDPAALAAAEALRIDRTVIRVRGIGRHEVVLGEATLANGVLTVAQADLADPWPDSVRVSSEGFLLEIRSLEDGRPAFDNEYLHGWWPGTERVEVVLVFEARRAEPGATIEIRNLVVR
jgi:hypothetical protein